MADVFISYANEDRERVRKLASSLESRGWSVWWDRKIIAGQTFDQVIEHEIETAKSVVVLWSDHSITSEWVKNEATVASERGVLVPALIDRVKPPLEFRRKQTADLVGWEGDPLREGFQALCDGVAATTKISGATLYHSTPSPLLMFCRNHRWTLGVIAALAIVLGFVAYKGLVVSPQLNGTSVVEHNIGQSSPTLNIVPTEGNGIDNPLPLELGLIYKITLEKNEEYYLKLSSPAINLGILLDMRRSDSTYSNLQSALSVLHQDGEMLWDNAISFNEIDVGYRKTALWSSKQPAILSFKLLNENETADFWLTVLNDPASQLIPFFGEVVPRSLALGQATSGVLDTNEYVYYITSLPKGDYKVILDFSNSKRENTNIQGYLAILDADGGNQRSIIRFNEIDVSYRKIATLSLKKDETKIMKIHNGNKGVNFELKIVAQQYQNQ